MIDYLSTKQKTKSTTKKQILNRKTKETNPTPMIDAIGNITSQATIKETNSKLQKISHLEKLPTRKETPLRKQISYENETRNEFQNKLTT